MGDQLDNVFGDKLFYRNAFTVGDLLKFIEEHQIPHDVPVVYQRIEDIYFERNGWQTLKKEGESWHRAKQFNDDLDSGKYEDKEKYPNATPELWKKTPDDVMENLKEEYVSVHSPVLFDKEYLYLTSHY